MMALRVPLRLPIQYLPARGSPGEGQRGQRGEEGGELDGPVGW